jgi:DNA-directed RNA polymerase subunit RPC12/RpoP
MYAMKRPEILLSILRPVRRKIKDSVRIWRAPIDRTQLCPVCGECSSRILKFGPPAFVTGPSSALPEVKNGTKYRCTRCKHLYSNWLSGDLDRTAEIYSGVYAQDQVRSTGDRKLQEEALLRFIVTNIGSPDKARLLDFGCGSNTAATMQLRKEGHDAHCCDILDQYDYDGEIFFQYDMKPGRWLHYFDGIVSTETIEHLSDTVEAWTYFNRVLRLGGMMAHSFPNQLHYGLDDSDVANPFHVCLFSDRSLKILTSKTGFELRSINEVEGVDREVFLFEKVKEI